MAKCPVWRHKLQNSLKQNSDLVFSNYFQLATVRSDGRPANRTVVFRDFLKDTDDITFNTDCRYQKVAEAAYNPAAEVAWYFTKSREQYRLSGTLTIVGPKHESRPLQDARTLAWKNMSDKARAQYQWPKPGAPKVSQENTSTLPPPTADQPPLPTFCLSVLHIQEVDYYQLFGQVRFKYILAGNDWQEVELNP